MNKHKINKLLEYCSPTLIFSYFLVHNIFLVFIGIILSLYLINIDYIYTIMRSINKKTSQTKVSKEIAKNDKAISIESIQNKLIKEDSNFTLVETIEELGFIPSKDKNNDINAA